MFKQFLLIIAASIAAIFFKDQLVHLLGLLIAAHNRIATALTVVFSGDSAGQIIRGVIALVAIPAILGGAISIAWWLGRKSTMPYLFTVVWVTWTVLLTALLAQVG